MTYRLIILLSIAFVSCKHIHKESNKETQVKKNVEAIQEGRKKGN